MIDTAQGLPSEQVKKDVSANCYVYGVDSADLAEQLNKTFDGHLRVLFVTVVRGAAGLLMAHCYRKSFTHVRES